MDFCENELLAVASEERISVSKLLSRTKNRRIMILKNKVCKYPKITAIGDGLRTKINANIGLSDDISGERTELRKALFAQKCGADLLADLSVAKNMDDLSDLLLSNTRIPVATIPTYYVAVFHKNHIEDADEDDFLDAIRNRAKRGYDPIEIHATVNLSNVTKLQRHDRLIPTVSRGGAIIARWMISNNKENPLSKHYEYILEMAKDLDFSLGFVPTFRPGCIYDSLSPDYGEEIMAISKLVEKALVYGIQVRIPGPNHLPLNKIRQFIHWEKKVCRSVPLGALGPVVTDVSVGYDHISHAIGAATAASGGANFITAITRTEDLGLPTIQEISEGIISARIAAHAADISKYKKKWMDWDKRIGEARSRLDWESVIKNSINPARTERICKRTKNRESGCSMCGEYCPIKSFKPRTMCSEKVS